MKIMSTQGCLITANAVLPVGPVIIITPSNC